MLAWTRAALAACLVLPLASAPAGAVIESTFDFDLDGWTTDNGGPLVPFSVGGNPGGYAQLDNDELSTAHLFAPPKFLGNLSAYDGGTLSFDGQTIVGPGVPPAFGPDDYGVVRISGSGISGIETRLAPRGPFPTPEGSADLAPDAVAPPKVWQTFSVPFTAASFGVSQGEWDEILSNVTEIRLTLEGFGGPAPDAPAARGVLPNEVQGLDNPRLAEGAPPTDELEPFLCYKAKPTQGTPRFESRDVSLVDAFETRETQVVKPKALCNPADVAGIPAPVPDAHFESYQIKQGEKHEKRRGLPVQTQFGPLSLDTKKPDRLLVPAAKSLSEPPTAPTEPAFDHFKCYKVKLSKGFPKLPKGTTVTVADQFAPTRTFLVKKPTRLCLPVDKNGEGVQHPDFLLSCFKVKPAKGEPKHEKRTGVFLAQQFGVEQLDTVKEEELCTVAVAGGDKGNETPD